MQTHRVYKIHAARSVRTLLFAKPFLICLNKFWRRHALAVTNRLAFTNFEDRISALGARTRGVVCTFYGNWRCVICYFSISFAKLIANANARLRSRGNGATSAQDERLNGRPKMSGRLTPQSRRSRRAREPANGEISEMRHS